MAPPPTVYVLHGEDDLAIGEFLARLIEKLGDPTTVQLNLLQASGDQADPADIETACHSAPFLAARRLVVLRPVGKIGAPFARLARLLENLPETTGLVLVEPKTLPPDHPLLAWAAGHPQQAFVRSFQSPRGAALVRWILQRAEHLGGEAVCIAVVYLARRQRLFDVYKLISGCQNSHHGTADNRDNLSPQRGKHSYLLGTKQGSCL